MKVDVHKASLNLIAAGMTREGIAAEVRSTGATVDNWLTGKVKRTFGATEELLIKLLVSKNIAVPRLKESRRA